MNDESLKKRLELVQALIKRHCTDVNIKECLKVKPKSLLNLILAILNGDLSDNQVSIQLDYTLAKYDVILHLNEKGGYIYSCACKKVHKNAQDASQCCEKTHNY